MAVELHMEKANLIGSFPCHMTKMSSMSNNVKIIQTSSAQKSMDQSALVPRL